MQGIQHLLARDHRYIPGISTDQEHMHTCLGNRVIPAGRPPCPQAVFWRATLAAQPMRRRSGPVAPQAAAQGASLYLGMDFGTSGARVVAVDGTQTPNPSSNTASPHSQALALLRSGRNAVTTACVDPAQSTSDVFPGCQRLTTSSQLLPCMLTALLHRECLGYLAWQAATCDLQRLATLQLFHPEPPRQLRAGLRTCNESRA